MFLFGCLTRRGPRQADSSRDNFFICENCRQIDFQDLYDNPILNKEDQLSGPGYPLKFTPFCALCCLLELTPETNGKLELRSWLFSSTHSDWASTKVPGAKTSVCLRTYPFSATDSPQQIPTTRNISQVFFMSYGTYMEGPGVLKPQAVQCTPDYAAARSWLKNCQQHHGSECNHLRPVVDGLCFIDCTSRTIVEASKNSRWIALSYVWGKQPNLWEHREDAHVGAHLSNDVPQTIEDAITVTQELGYQYLWVDEYCINQKTNHREDQISKMDQIYHQADLTIVAAAGDNRSYGLPGVGTRQRSMCKVIHLNDMVILDVGPDPRTAARLSSWASRGWTFQESILSTRSLLFTDHQMSFHCEKASWMEALGGPKYLVEPQHIDWNLWPIFQALFDFLKRKGHARWVRFMIIASNYSYRHLTDDTDVLNAISGALKHIGHSRSPVYNLSGLPFHDYPRDTKSDTLGYCVAIALSWYHKIVFYVPQRISMFPSW
ncbi:HET-domain-containing protein, partial [Ophiobolus disseminans]